MNITESTPTVTKTPKVKRVHKAVKKAVKKDKLVVNNGELHPHKIAVLRCMTKSARTLEQMEEKTGLTRRSVYHAVWHLREDGFIKEEKADAELYGRSTPFALTAKGNKAL